MDDGERCSNGRGLRQPAEEKEGKVEVKNEGVDGTLQLTQTRGNGRCAVTCRHGSVSETEHGQDSHDRSSVARATLPSRTSENRHLVNFKRRDGTHR